MAKSQKINITLEELNQFDKYSKTYSNMGAVANNIFYLKHTIDELSKQLDDNKRIIKEFMLKEKIGVISDNLATITLRDAYVKDVFSSTELKKSDIELYNKFVKKQEQAETLVVKA